MNERTVTLPIEDWQTILQAADNSEFYFASEEGMNAIREALCLGNHTEEFKYRVGGTKDLPYLIVGCSCSVCYKGLWAIYKSHNLVGGYSYYESAEMKFDFIPGGPNDPKKVDINKLLSEGVTGDWRKL